MTAKRMTAVTLRVATTASVLIGELPRGQDTGSCLSPAE
jgi:hypothetical protein